MIVSFGSQLSRTSSTTTIKTGEEAYARKVAPSAGSSEGVRGETESGQFRFYAVCIGTGRVGVDFASSRNAVLFGDGKVGLGNEIYSRYQYGYPGVGVVESLEEEETQTEEEDVNPGATHEAGEDS